MNRRQVFIAGIVSIFIAGFLFNAAVAGETKAPAKSPAPVKADLNKATAEQLSKCPGITPSLAKAIVECRVKSGPFKSPEDLLKVKGMTREIFGKAKPKMEKDIIYLLPAASGEDDEEPSLKPSKC
jgi:competence ComEA-like helix-hairpin-helix protein